MLKSSKIGNNKRGKKMYRGGNNEKKEAVSLFSDTALHYRDKLITNRKYCCPIYSDLSLLAKTVIAGLFASCRLTICINKC